MLLTYFPLRHTVQEIHIRLVAMNSAGIIAQRKYPR